MPNEQYHIASGDSLAEDLTKCDIGGEIIVCRECLIEGPLDGDSFEDFLNTRAAFISETYDGSSAGYYEKVAAEFEKIKRIPVDSEVNLWFGSDLFCQANMWFICDMLGRAANSPKIFRVFPFEKGEPSLDFSSDESDDLKKSLKMRQKFSGDDVQLAQSLWKAYKAGDNRRLSELSKTGSVCFNALDATCRAHIERFGDDPRPQRVLNEIMSDGKTDFSHIFQEFSSREAIYGFGDLQVRKMLENL